MQIFFYITDPASRLPVPPVIVGNSGAVEELAAVLDSSVSIECVAAGSPLPQLNWLRNGLPLPVSSHIRLLSAGQVLRYVSRQCTEDEFISFKCKYANVLV